MSNEAMRVALELAIRQNEHDMLMTGDELRKCKAALSQQPTKHWWLRNPIKITAEHHEIVKGSTCFSNDGAERDWSELEAQQPKCSCDGSGLVHSPDGQFLGACDEHHVSQQPAQPTVKESLTVQAQPTEHVMGLLGAACYVINKYEPESNLLQKIRDVTFDRKPSQPSCEPEQVNHPYIYAIAFNEDFER